MKINKDVHPENGKNELLLLKVLQVDQSDFVSSENIGETGRCVREECCSPAAPIALQPTCVSNGPFHENHSAFGCEIYRGAAGVEGLCGRHFPEYRGYVHKVVRRESARRDILERLVEWIQGMLGRWIATSLKTAEICGYTGCP